METKKPLRVADVARLFDVKPGTVYAWVKAGKIEHEKTPGGGIRFDPDKLAKPKGGSEQ